MLEMAMQERELELIAARHAAEDANRAKSAFLATMSHEIRTPLNAMIGNLTLIGMSGLNEEQRQYMQNCTSASQGLLRVINDVLDFSKIEADKIELVNENYSPAAMLDNLVNMFACRAEEKRLRLNLEITGPLPGCILGDCQRLSQVISNLLSNAIKFTHQGDITISASTGHSEHGAMLLVVSVSDSGIGIPPEQHNVIFDSFTQLDNFTTRRQGGTGLGLAICRRLVEIMGGEIALVSAPDVGSTFTIRIPVAVCDAPAAKEIPKKTGKVTPRTILLADDDALGRMVVTTLLERKGHTVTAVENGARLLETMQNCTFDILLTDISMPDMEGTEVARIIRSRESSGSSPIPIIALTAHAFNNDRERFIDCGISGYIAKPFNFEELLNLIEELCSARIILPVQAASDISSCQSSEPLLLL
jgi:CheY-like chemotaxis protein